MKDRNKQKYHAKACRHRNSVELLALPHHEIDYSLGGC